MQNCLWPVVIYPKRCCMTDRRVYNGSPTVGLLQSRLGCYHSALLEWVLSHHLKSHWAGRVGTGEQVRALGGKSSTFRVCRCETRLLNAFNTDSPYQSTFSSLSFQEGKVETAKLRLLYEVHRLSLLQSAQQLPPVHLFSLLPKWQTSFTQLPPSLRHLLKTPPDSSQRHNHQLLLLDLWF